MQFEILPKSSFKHLRFFLLGVSLAIVLTGTCQTSFNRIDILKKLTEYYNQGDFPNAYKTAKILADFHQQRNDLHHYINYSNNPEIQSGKFFIDR